MRRSKTSEARVQLAKLFDSTSSYFNEEHVNRGETQLLGAGGDVQAAAPHKCPHPADTPAGGEAGITPILDLNCNDGPGGRCIPGIGGTVGGAYEMSDWNDNPVWNALNFQQEQGHYFHYNFKAVNNTSGFGDCQFTAQAFGDLDDDAIYSTFERSGAADVNGVNAAVGLFMDQEVE
jgi:type IV pilus assembly protein PilA